MEFSELLETILAGEELEFERAQHWMDRIMDGELDEAQIGGFLVALRGRGESPEEIAGLAASMRSHARNLELDDDLRPVVDTCGTGGDAAETFNISTLAAVLAAARGARVAKHGNRSVSSSCGSADLLEALGVDIELDPSDVKTCIQETGIGFMFAPAFHIAMKHAIGPRKSLGIRTVFNLLGPLTNPARADRQLLGVFSPKWIEPVARALKKLGVDQALVVHGLDGMDEISLVRETRYAHLESGEISYGEFKPEGLGLEKIKPEEISGGSPRENAGLTRELFSGEAPRPVEDIVCVNAGAVLMLSDLAEDVQSGVELARSALKDGSAAQTLELFVEVSNSVGEE